MSMKNSMTPAGIELATFRFVAQHLNHCATAVPNRNEYLEYFLGEGGGKTPDDRADNVTAFMCRMS